MQSFSQSNKNIWVLEDNKSIQFVYEQILRIRYNIEIFDCIEKLDQTLKKSDLRPDLLIADLLLPDGNLFDYISNESSIEINNCPLIFVSSIRELDVLRACFDNGALDYLTKPFDRSELLVKVENILKKQIDNTNKIQIDPVTLIVKAGNEQTPSLTTREMQIFSCILKSKNEGIKREVLIRDVWGSTQVGEKTLDVHLFNLRKKLLMTNLRIFSKKPDLFFLSNNRMN